MRKIVAIILLALMVATGLGCVALSEYATPAPVDKAAVKYAAEAGVIDANSFRGYANYEKARRLERALQSAYKVYTLGLDQAKERHELDYANLEKVVAANTKTGKQREAALFGETGLISMGIGLAGMGGLGGFLGLMRKRPGDITPAELEAATVQASVEVKDKERQLLEIIGGVSEFMKTYDKTTEPGMALRASLKTTTNSDTKQVVAAIKAV